MQEHVEIDPHIDFGIGLDAALNVNKITKKVISDFVSRFNAGKLELDETLYSFIEEEDSEVDR